VSYEGVRICHVQLLGGLVFLLQGWRAALMSRCQLLIKTGFLKRLFCSSEVVGILDVQSQESFSCSGCLENTDFVGIELAYFVGFLIFAVKLNFVDRVFLFDY
jgi:hypothetical protein